MNGALFSCLKIVMLYLAIMFTPWVLARVFDINGVRDSNGSPKSRKEKPESFTDELVKKLQLKGYAVDISNGKLTASKGEDIVCPSVSLDDLVALNKAGMRVDSIVNEITKLKRPQKEYPSFSRAFNNDIVYKVINIEQNRELLKDVPHKEYGDMALCLMVNIEEDGKERAVLVNNDSYKEVMWKIAETTAPTKEPPCLLDEDGNNLLFTGVINEEPVYVLTTENTLRGAAALFYGGVQKRLYEILGEYYALPTSTDEWMIVPVIDDDDEELERLRSILNESNKKARNNLLSNSVYRYNGKALLKI